MDFITPAWLKEVMTNISRCPEIICLLDRENVRFLLFIIVSAKAVVGYFQTLLVKADPYKLFKMKFI